MLRRLKQDVELKLPPKKGLLVNAPMTSMQQEVYKSTVDKTVITVQDSREKCKPFLYKYLYCFKYSLQRNVCVWWSENGHVYSVCAHSRDTRFITSENISLNK